MSELIDLRIEIDSVANPEATSDTKFKKVRKAEAMGTAAAEPLAVTEKKRRVDGVFLVESEADPSNKTAATPRPSNWATLTPSQKSMWRRRNERNK